MSLINDMLKIDRLIIWEVDGTICTCFEKYDEVSDGIALVGLFGRGSTVDESLRDYARQISGRKLVANAMSNNREELTVLVIGEN